MVPYAGQAILHATIAALVIEALLWLWRVDDPGERLRLRWVVLLSPLVTAALMIFVPARSAPSFAVQWALYSGVRWDMLRIGSLGTATLLTYLLAGLGVVLYLRDAIPFLADRTSRREPDVLLPEPDPAWTRFRHELAASALAAGIPIPEAELLASATPVLLCAGIDRPRIVVSVGALDRLDDDELRAALAHELEHASSRDPLMGWWLMAARTLQAFNPAIQIAGRQAVVDIERRADLAVVRRGLARPLASAIGRLGAEPESRSDLVSSPEQTNLARRLLARAHLHALDVRCARLLETPAPGRSGLSLWHLGVASATLAVMLFFVV